MKITPAMIMDTLGAFSAVSQLPQDHSFQFDGIHLLSARTEHPDPEFLYIGTSSQVSAVSPSILHEICIVCIGTPEHSEELLREHNANLILLPRETDFISLVNHLYSTFDWYKDWANQIEQAVLLGKPYQDIMDIAKAVFGENPLIFVNSAYNVLGSSIASTPYNDRINDILKCGYYPKEDTDGLASMGYQARGSAYSIPTIIHPPTYMGCSLYVLAFHASNGIFLGFVTVYFVKDKPTDGLFDLFCYFAAQIRNYYYSQIIRQDILTPTPLEIFMTDLIEHTFEEETYLIDRARVLKLPLNASYRLGIIQWDDFSLNQANYVMGRLRSCLNFPYFKILLYHQSVLMILQGEISSLKLMEEVTQFYNEFTTLLQICHGYAGFSTICDSLLKLDVAYKQACAAAKFGIRLAPEEGVYFYSRFYIYDLLDSYTSRFELKDMFIQKLKRLENPDEGNYSNLELLRNYLLTERSISTTAKLMHMHRNSVIYRLGKIQELLGIDLNNPDVRLRVLISFKILELINGRLKPLPPREIPEDDCFSELTIHE